MKVTRSSGVVKIISSKVKAVSTGVVKSGTIVTTKRKDKKSYGEEHELQTKICNWFHSEYDFDNIGYKNKNKHILVSSLNGIHLSKMQATKAKREGMRKGVSDLTLYTKFGVCFIEVKILTDNSKQSTEQKAFQKSVIELGFDYQVVRSLGEFIDLITKIDKKILDK